MKELRLLKANEIDVRIGSINEKGATLLLYKDARVDMNILDESGAKWKRSHEVINGNLFCTISIWDEDIKEWISRQDVGVESNTEKEKGQASDAFKRAGFNFGIGRELYTAPFIWVSADTYSPYQRNGKYGTYDKFTVTKIGYDNNKEINVLEIKNVKSGDVIYRMGSPAPTTVIRNRQEEAKEAQDEQLAKAKVQINTWLEELDYVLPVQKKAFIISVLGKPTVDTLEDADLLADAIEEQREEIIDF